jgi:magnesium transporter
MSLSHPEALLQDSLPTAELLYLLAGDPPELAEMLAALQSADIADLLDELPADAAARVVAAMPFDLAVQLFDEPGLEQRREIFHHLDEKIAAPLLEGMSSDEQVALIREMDEAERSRLLTRLDRPTQQALALLLRYPTDTAGGIMTTEFLSVPGTWTADQALRHIREVGRVKETVYAIYVVDAANRLVHVVSLRELVTSDRQQKMAEVGARKTPIVVAPLLDREEVARVISKYDLIAVPVVEEDGRILGIVTVDDVIDVLIAEETEDVQKLGGLEALDEPYLEVGMAKMLRKRGGWLAALFLGETLTATAMGFFEHEIAQAVVLALFIPLIISSGGNSGSQATTLVIRAMALGQVKLTDWWRVVRRELAAGLSLGLLLGTIGFIRIIAWQLIGESTRGASPYGEHYVLVALTIFLSLIGIVTWGTLIGATLPFLLRRLGLDPASASAPFVATVVDVTGIVIYFSVAAGVLRGTLL